MKKELISTALFCALGCLSTPALADISNATAHSISTPYGQKVVSVDLTYPENLQAANLKASDFKVEDRTITAVSVHNNVLTLSLSAEDKNATMTYSENRQPSVEREIAYKVQQLVPILAKNGKTLSPAEIKVSQVQNDIVDEFKQLEFKDPTTGIVVKYNLFVPRNYDPKKSYPLVMFIHDAGSTNSNVRNTLLQGTGATSFASEQFQAEHPAFVLAPQFDHVITNDNSDDPVDLDPTINLIKSLSQKYNIDQNRLYTTGQSGGAMMSLAMNIKYPNFFAASYIVAGQWAANKTPPIAKNKLFILVSEDDQKAFPGENAITQTLAENGAIVAHTTLTNGNNIGLMNQEIEKLLQKKANVYYAVIKSGTLPDQIKDPNSANPGRAHVGTWKVSYELNSIKEWLFKQHKDNR